MGVIIPFIMACRGPPCTLSDAFQKVGAKGGKLPRNNADCGALISDEHSWARNPLAIGTLQLHWRYLALAR